MQTHRLQPPVQQLAPQEQQPAEPQQFKAGGLQQPAREEIRESVAYWDALEPTGKAKALLLLQVLSLLHSRTLLLKVQAGTIWHSPSCPCILGMAPGADVSVAVFEDDSTDVIDSRRFLHKVLRGCQGAPLTRRQSMPGVASVRAFWCPSWLTRPLGARCYGTLNAKCRHPQANQGRRP